MEHGKIIFDGDPDKAIELYMPLAGEEQYKENWMFSSEERQHQKQDELFAIEMFQFAEKGGYDIPQGKNMEFFLRVRAKEESGSMFFRIIYYDKDDSLVGMTDTTTEAFRLNEGENLFEGCCNTAYFAPGIYKLRLELCGYNRDGLEYLYEAIDRIVYFRITENKEHRNLRWHHSWWGECDFGTMEIRHLRGGN